MPNTSRDAGTIFLTSGAFAFSTGHDKIVFREVGPGALALAAVGHDSNNEFTWVA